MTSFFRISNSFCAERWPALLTKVIADVEKTMDEEDNPGLHSEGQKIIRDLIALNEDMAEDRPLL